MAVKERIRIRLKGYDHQLVDSAAEKIVETVKRTGARVSGPIPLPTEKEVVTILRAVHKYKDSREQFEMRTHKRLIDILRPSNKTVEALQGLELPAGVEIEIKLKFLSFMRCQVKLAAKCRQPITKGGEKNAKMHRRQENRHDPDF